MGDFLSLLFALSLAGSLMALLLLGMKRVLGKKLSSTVYYYLWLLVLLRFVLPLPGLVDPSGSFASREIQYRQSEAQRVNREFRSPGFRIDESRSDVIHSDQTTALSVPENSAPDETSSFKLGREQLLGLLGGIYIAGALLRFGAYCFGYLRFAASLRPCFSKPGPAELEEYKKQPGNKKPELICCAAVKTPMLMGLIRPLLVLPRQDYRADMLHNIFRHELMHYRRGDILYKWFAVLVFSLQWFNPLCPLLRREINRSCELSCDEMLIAGMDRAEKQSYGDALISLAAGGALPAGVIATTFATEKRNLRERLDQIMKFKKKKSAVFTALLALILLVGCGAALGPQAEAAPTTTQAVSDPRAEAAQTEAVSADFDPDVPIVVKNVDELLAAIGSDRQIWLERGDYELDKAADYGKEGGEHYSWVDSYDGYELVIRDVENMSIVGRDDDHVYISADSQYANVLRFEKCSNVMLAQVIVGHDEQPGVCSGGVVYLDSCQYFHVDDSSLYGCGTIGLYAENCKKVFLTDCNIYDCSASAVCSYESYDIRVSDCDIYDCNSQYAAVFEANNSTGFAVYNNDIRDCSPSMLVTANHTQQFYFVGNELDDLDVTGSLFTASAYPVIFDDCEFENVRYSQYAQSFGSNLPELPPVDLSGAEVPETAIRSMEQRDFRYEGPVEAEPVDIERRDEGNGRGIVSVKTVDELLAAIAPHTTIELDAELFDLSTAADYGAYGSQYYYWNACYDGPELVITGVEGLRIVGDGAVTVSATPRYANVLSFLNCSELELSGFTAGHTEEPGSCTGGVLAFDNCEEVLISDCALYGCGIIGINAYYSEEFLVENTEIYECSQGAVWLGTCQEFRFENCDIHDCSTPEIFLNDVREIYYDSELIKNGAYTVSAEGLDVYEFPEG